MSALTDMLGTTQRGHQSYSGLDPSRLGSNTLQGWGNASQSTYKPSVTQQTYQDPSTGEWVNQGNGWVGAGGMRVSDLGGYLGMRGQQKQGADFGQYQNQLNALLQNPSSIQNDPSYQFRLGQGQQAIERSAAARGMGASGNVLAELAKYGQGMASEEYGNQFNRLRDLMRGAQQFGLDSGYYAPNPHGIFGGGVGGTSNKTSFY